MAFSGLEKPPQRAERARAGLGADRRCDGMVALTARAMEPDANYQGSLGQAATRSWPPVAAPSRFRRTFPNPTSAKGFSRRWRVPSTPGHPGQQRRGHPPAAARRVSRAAGAADDRDARARPIASVPVGDPRDARARPGLDPELDDDGRWCRTGRARGTRCSLARRIRCGPAWFTVTSGWATCWPPGPGSMR
jgi:hypothetical protein